MTIYEALETVNNAAHEWAGEYGFGWPDEAIRVFQAIKLIEGELMNDEEKPCGT